MKSKITCFQTLMQIVLLMSPIFSYSQYISGKGNDATAPLHLMKPDYDIPYGETKPEDIRRVLEKIYTYLDQVTPVKLIDRNNGNEVSQIAKAGPETVFKPGDFRLISYEWGVTYAAMLEAGEATDDNRFTKYALDRINFIGKVAEHYKSYQKGRAGNTNPVHSVLAPGALDDAGAMAAAIVKATGKGADKKLTVPMIDNFINYIMTGQYRLTDGTLARNRPLPNSLWLDDLYMSLPALVQMGVMTGDGKYFDEAVKQYRLFAGRMFNEDRGLYMHGWVEGMDPHPQFHWARANGWAILTKTEMLDVLPENHPGRAEILAKFRRHAYALAACQDKTGFWHQLLDRNDSYLETSATAIYAYCIARAVNKGWLDARAYGPMVLLAWNAVSTKVNEKGQVEGTCVGTGMGFDPAFYYYRPVNRFAAHGYGPVLLAGAEVYRFLQKHHYEINDSAVMVGN